MSHVLAMLAWLLAPPAPGPANPGAAASAPPAELAPEAPLAPETPPQLKVKPLVPFGIELGAELPKGFKQRFKCRGTALGLACTSAPRTYPGMLSYVVILWRDRVSEVTAFTLIEDDSFGSKARDFYQKLKSALSAKYGGPGIDDDYMREGGIWTAPAHWARSLQHGERVLQAFWVVPGYSMKLSAFGRRESRFLTVEVTYQHDELTSKVVDAHAAKAAEAL